MSFLLKVAVIYLYESRFGFQLLYIILTMEILAVSGLVVAWLANVKDKSG